MKENILANNTYKYHEDIYKLKQLSKNKNDSNNLILITSVNPTEHGEGKTTTLIGLVDAFNYFKHNTNGCLRQPSVGPYFGFKGGATGSGKCSLKNEDKINIGLTGDFEKIALLNNLIITIIENDIFNKNIDIDLKTLKWRRCVDINDRSLRQFSYKLNNVNFKTSYTITAASDIMALFCLSKSKYDFITKLENAIICKTTDQKNVYIKDLNLRKSFEKIISDALLPNLVFTQNNNPIYMHGGPFANIAHGTSSIISINEARNNANYTFVECGFGSDLGLEKFINIVSRESKITPNLVVYAISYASLKKHGNNDKNKMINFLNKHLSICDSFNLNHVVLINKFANDKIDELNSFINECNKQNIKIMISDLYSQPLSKSKKLVDFIISNIRNNKVKFTYDLNDSIELKAQKISNKIYNAKKISFSSKVKNILNNEEIKKYYLCIAKSYKEIIPENKVLKITDVYINHCAKLIVLIADKIFLMPGLPKKPNAKG